LTIAPASITTDTKSQASSSNQDTVSTSSDQSAIGGRKKTSSVSFSVDDNENADKVPVGAVTGEVKKSKMLKRLSYPLSWVEGLTGESGTPSGKQETESAPTTSDSSQSVFSKVFSR